MKNILQMIAAVLLVTSLFSCKQKREATNMVDDIIPVQVVTLQQQTIQQPIFASGQFTTNDESNLSFKNGGIVRKIYVKEGDAVTKGQLLAILDVTEINTVAQQASISLQKAQRDYERASRLFHDSVATLEQMQNAKTALEIAKQQKANANYNQSTSQLRATQSGYVLQKFVNDGQVVGPGTPILQINGANNSNWILKVGVSDHQWANINIGDKATITTDAVTNHQFDAVVTQKPKGIDPVSGTFVIQLQLTGNDKGGIATGLFGKAKISPSKSADAWTIPIEALLDGDQNKGYVFVTNDDSTAQKISVNIKNISNDQVVIDAGLEHVKKLIIGGNAYLDNGSKIKIVQ